MSEKRSHKLNLRIGKASQVCKVFKVCKVNKVLKIFKVCKVVKIHKVLIKADNIFDIVSDSILKF